MIKFCRTCGAILFRHADDHPLEEKRGTYHCNVCETCPAEVRDNDPEPVQEPPHRRFGFF